MPNKKKIKLTVAVSLVVLLAVSIGINRFNVREDSDAVVPPIDAADEADRYLQMASQNYFFHEFSEAAGNYRKAIVIYESQKKFKRAAKTYESMGDLYKFAHQPEAAQANYLEAAQYHERIRNPMGQARALKRLGDMYMEKKEFDSAGPWYKKALVPIDQAPPHMVQGNVLESLGRYYWKTEHIPEAIEQYTRAREVYASLKYQMGYDLTVAVLTRLRKGKKAETYF